MTTQQHKIYPLSELKDIIVKEKEQQKRIVFTNGCFDLLHAGHVHYLNQAKALGDRLIVAINSDASLQNFKGPKRPLTPESQRLSVLAALSMIDYVCTFEETTPTATIVLLQPDIHVKGGDYQKEQLPEYDTVLSYGGAVEIIPLLPTISTTNIIETIRQRYP